MGFGARCYETTTFVVQLLGHDLLRFPFIAYWTTLGTLDISYLWSFRVQHVAMFLFLLVRTRISLVSSVGLYQVCGKRCFCGHVLFFAHSQRRRRLVRSIGNRLNQGSEAVSSFLVIMCIRGRGVTCTCVALGQSFGYRGTKGATIPNTMIRLPFFQTSRLALSSL